MRGYVRKRRGPKHRRKPFIAVADFGYRGGKRQRAERSFASEAEAYGWLDEQRGKHQPAPVGTVGALLQHWYEWGTGVRGWSPGHARRTAQVIEYDLAPLHRIRLNHLTVADIEELLAQRMRDGLAPSTVKKARDALSGAFALAIRQGAYDGPNIVRRVQSPELGQHEPRYLTPEQVRVLLHVLDDDWLGTHYVLQMSLALRPAEAIGLYWTDLDGNALTIQRGIQKVGSEFVIVEPKRGSVRTLYVPDALLTRLDKHRERQDANLRRLLRKNGGRYSEAIPREALMFRGMHGGYLNQAHVNKHLGRLLERAGLPRITQYELRHTGATLMLALGVPLEQIRDVLGHRTLDMSLRYARVMDRQRRDVAKVMDAWMAADGSVRNGLGGTSGGTIEPEEAETARSTG